MLQCQLMRALRWLFLPVLMATFLVASGASAAGRKPSEFNAPTEVNEEELAAAKARSKSKLNGFDEKMEEKPKPIPWAFIGLAAIAFTISSVFMVRAFRNTSKELKQTDAYAGGRRSSDD